MPDNVNSKDHNSILPDFHLEHWMVMALLMGAYDIIAVNVSYFCGLLLRFDFRYSFIPSNYLGSFFRFAPIYTLFCLITFTAFRLYRSIWRFASYDELIRVIEVTAITTIFHTIGITLLFHRMPISYYLFGAVLQFILIISVRFAYRFILLLRNHTMNREKGASNIMVVGAGNAGQALIRDIHRAQEVNGRVACIIDDNPNKKGRYIDGVPVVGLDCIIGSYQGIG